MQTIRDVASLRQAVAALARTGTVALVPTMGALHAGHMALVALAASRAAHVVASIFVNPIQFGPGEDLDAYPRREEADARMLRDARVAVLWAPAVTQMYPKGFATTVSVGGLGEGLCGASRPGHFDGVATVVAKLLGQVRPDLAVFGEKDWQQLAVIRRMARDLDLGVEIVAAPIERDDDGLALSSRNAYLDSAKRAVAARLPALLFEAAQAIGRGEPASLVLLKGAERMRDAGLEVEYLELRDAATLGASVEGRPARLLVAARVGRTRLIDNVPVLPR